MKAPQFRAQSEKAGWAGTCWVGRWKEGKGQEVTTTEEWEGDVRPDIEVPVDWDSTWAQLWVPKGIWGSFNRDKM